MLVRYLSAVHKVSHLWIEILDQPSRRGGRKGEEPWKSAEDMGQVLECLSCLEVRLSIVRLIHKMEGIAKGIKRDDVARARFEHVMHFGHCTLFARLLHPSQQFPHVLLYDGLQPANTRTREERVQSVSASSMDLMLCSGNNGSRSWRKTRKLVRMQAGKFHPIDIVKLTPSSRGSILRPVDPPLTRTWIKHVVEVWIFEVHFIWSNSHDRAYDIRMSKRLATSSRDGVVLTILGMHLIDNAKVLPALVNFVVRLVPVSQC